MVMRVLPLFNVVGFTVGFGLVLGCTVVFLWYVAGCVFHGVFWCATLSNVSEVRGNVMICNATL